LRANEIGAGKIKVGRISLPVGLEEYCVTERWEVVVIPPRRRNAGRCVECVIYGENNTRREIKFSRLVHSQKPKTPERQK